MTVLLPIIPNRLWKSGAETDETMHITVKCFAEARDVLARDEFCMDVPEGTTVEVVAEEIRRLSSQLADMPFVLSLNMEYPPEGTLVKDGDELAIIPPVSGW